MPYLDKLILAFAVSLATSTHAALIDHSSYVTDTATGLDWLKPNKTLVLSYQEIIEGSGGYIEAGWRYATLAQLENLFQPITNTANGVFENDSANFQNALSAVQTLGITAQVDHTYDPVDGGEPIRVVNYATQGLYNDEDGNNLVGTAGLQAFPIYTPNANVVNWGASPDAGRIDEKFLMVGSFLVRETTVVPEPATVSCIGVAMGLLLFALRCRRETRA